MRSRESAGEPTVKKAEAVQRGGVRRARAAQSDLLWSACRVTQTVAAKRLGLPQPTLSKIINGRVSDLSLELLIRVAVRAGLAITLQTGLVPQEAGAFSSSARSRSSAASQSKLADAARQSLIESETALTPTQRLEAFLEHSQLLCALHEAGSAAEAQRARIALHQP